MKRSVSVHSAQNESIWTTTTKMPVCRRLATDIETDVCIVGAGIAGLTTGYLLCKEGRDVVILDDGPLAGGMTAVTTAHLSNAIDDRFTEIERWHGEEGSRLAAQSHGAAIDRIEKIARDHKIDCDFQRVDGYLFLAPEDDEQLLNDELEAAHRAGLTDVKKLKRTPLQNDMNPCLRFPNQARFHPYKYLAGVAKEIKRLGGRIYTNSHVDKLEGGKAANVQVGAYTVRCNSVVVATNTPINDWIVIHTKQAPYMTYVIGARVPRGSVPDALYWDTLDAYHYVRLQQMSAAESNGSGAHDLLIIGGEDHKTGQADDTEQRHACLEAWGRARFPSMEEIEFTWGGQCLETVDGLAFIGRNPLDERNVYVATGDSGMGITHGTIAGMLLTDMILDRENPWESLYDPSRKTVRAAAGFITENLNVAAQYTDWLTSSEVESIDEIEKGRGAVLRRGTKKIAVYRDNRGTTHEMSAVCSHLGCIVHWNGVESTWDCPCHGSRFDCRGEVVNGPANVGLSQTSSD